MIADDVMSASIAIAHRDAERLKAVLPNPTLRAERAGCIVCSAPRRKRDDLCGDCRELIDDVRFTREMGG